MTVIEQILGENEKDILEKWIKRLTDIMSRAKNSILKNQLKKDCSDFLRLFINATKSGQYEDLSAPNLKAIINHIKNLSSEREELGFTPTETAQYIFGLKIIIFDLFREKCRNDLSKIFDEITKLNNFLDILGLISFEEYVKGRDQVIREQAETLLELTTPIFSIWNKALILPIIGTLDRNRTQKIMENLIQKSKVITQKIEELLSANIIKTEPSIKKTDKNNFLLMKIDWDDRLGPKLTDSFPSEVNFPFSIKEMGMQLFQTISSMYGDKQIAPYPEGFLLSIENIQKKGYIYFDSYPDDQMREGSKNFMLALIAPTISYFDSLKIKKTFQDLASKIKQKRVWQIKNYYEQIFEILSNP